MVVKPFLLVDKAPFVIHVVLLLLLLSNTKTDYSREHHPVAVNLGTKKHIKL